MTEQRYDPHKAYERKGSCRNCGACCSLHCPRLIWVVLRDIKQGETVQTGTDNGALRSSCGIFAANTLESGCNEDVRRDYPYNPYSTLPGCGFYWVEVQADTKEEAAKG